MCRISGKVSFVDRKEQPVQDGIYDVEVCGENPKKSVNFLHIVKAYIPHMEGDTYVDYALEDWPTKLVEKRVKNGWSFRYGQEACGNQSYFVYSYNGKQTLYKLNEVPDGCPVEVLEAAANDWRLGCPGTLFGFFRDEFHLAPLWKKTYPKSLVVKDKVDWAHRYYTSWLYFLQNTAVEFVDNAVHIKTVKDFDGINVASGANGAPTIPDKIEGLVKYVINGSPENRFSSGSSYYGDEDAHGERVNISFGGGFAGWTQSEIPKGFQIEFSTIEKYISDLKDRIKETRELVEKTISILENIAAEPVA
jgi:hypothetical protein